MKTHFTWSIEKDDHHCPNCGANTILVVASREWSVDEETARLLLGDEKLAESLALEGVGIDAEVTGHFCHECDTLCSLSLNT